METVTGIFNSREAAESVIWQIHSLGISDEQIALLTPDMNKKEVEQRVPTADTEATGEGEAMGGAVGGAIGVAGGAHLGALTASLIIPGVGPVIAAGILGAAILGIWGTAIGVTVGEAVDEALLEGLPHDELYLYEYALRRGRSVVIVFADNEESAEPVRKIFAHEGAESIDAAGENWWREIRAAEEAAYYSSGRNFRQDELNYRLGFAAALNKKVQGKPFREVESKLNELYGAKYRDEGFRRGYERGLIYKNTSGLKSSV